MQIEKKIYELQKELSVISTKLEGETKNYELYKKLTEEALHKAEDGMNKRLEGMNEFRSQLKDQSNKFVTSEKMESLKESVEVLIKQVSDKLQTLSEGNSQRIRRLEDTKSNLEGRMYVVGVIWALILILASWYINKH